MKTIVEARYEGVFRMLDAVRAGAAFPEPFDEHVPTTKIAFDGYPDQEFKGQAFIPHLVYQDAKGKPIRSDREEPMTKSEYASAVRQALAQDNMTVQTKNGPVSGLRIPNERFERIGMMLVEGRRNAHRQVERLPEVYPGGPDTDEIVKSYLPPIERPPGGIGTKATLTSMLAVGMWKMRGFVDFYKRELNMALNGDDPRFREFYSMMRNSQEPILGLPESDSGRVPLLANEHIVVAHASPYMPDAMSGLTRILGFRGTKKKQNRLGEFETLSFERATKRVISTLGNPRIPDSSVWAYRVPRQGGRKVPVLLVHRHYGPAKPGKRPVKDSYRLIGPGDFGFDPHIVRERAVEKLKLDYAAPVPRITLP